MRTRAILEGERVTLDPRRALGSGGEATVFLVKRGRHAVAVKRYHAPTAERARKLEALLALRPALPPSIVAPAAPLFDEDGRDVVGFSMPLLPDRCEPFSQLGRKSFRDARCIGRRDVALALASLGRALSETHAAGVVVGDVNDQNELFSPTLAALLIDADSFQIPGFSCEVATEAFLDPLLYGPDPKAPCWAGPRPRTFSRASDWYAFAVLAFRALTGVHPFGGALDALPGLPERARAGVSVLDARVTLPAASRESVSLLPRDLTAIFEAIFHRRERGDFPVESLDRYAQEIVRCSCGLELPAGRLPCPRCSTPIRSTPAAPTGALSLSTVLEARGPLLAITTRGDDVLALALEDRALVLYVVSGGAAGREVLAARSSDEGFEVALSPERVAWVEAGGADGTSVALATGARTPFVTERALGRASFAVVGGVLYRVARGTVLACRVSDDAISESPVTAVMSEQSLLVGQGDALMIAERVLSERRVVAIRRGRRLDLELPPLEPGEALVDEALSAGPSSFAVLRSTSLRGQALFRAWVFDREGRPRGHTLLPVAGRAAEDAIQGGVLVGDAFLVATDAGLVREDLTGGAGPRTFPGTSGRVGRDALLAVAPHGLYAAHDRRVSLLRLGA